MIKKYESLYDDTYDTTETLKADTLKLKNKCEHIEKQLQEQIKDLESCEMKWKEMDFEAANIMTKNKKSVVKFNVSGKKFQTNVQTLLSLKDTLFYKLILCKKFDISKEIFFDRSPRMFSVILDFFRYKKISYNRFTNDELNDLKIEANYYEIGPISCYLNSNKLNPMIVKYEFSGIYNPGIGNVVSSNNLSDLSDRNLNTGICATYPGWIIFELSEECEISEIEIGGYTGNTHVWSPENGANAMIQTSYDKHTWMTVGNIPYGFGTLITTVNLTKSTAKYLKFQSNSNSYLGIGFLEIKENKNYLKNEKINY